MGYARARGLFRKLGDYFAAAYCGDVTISAPNLPLSFVLLKGHP
jgi:hypothetical protein